MRTKIMLSAAIAASALTAMPAAAQAQYYGGYSQYDGYRDGYRNGYRNYDRRDYRRYNARHYDARRYADRRYGNYYGRRCDSGSTGTILGAIAGGLLGREIAGRGDRTVGTIIGGAAGALAGRAIDRNDCRR